MTNPALRPNPPPMGWFRCHACGGPVSQHRVKATPEGQPVICGGCTEDLAEEAEYVRTCQAH
jgi:uncharacterized CHY-type Zn-finger protein